MAAILTAAEMREVEARAMASGHVTGLDLMERAGQGVVDAILAHWPELSAAPRPAGPPRVTVLCGPGNNGGDGFVVARLLALRGWRVRVLSNADPLTMPPDAREMHDRWAALGPILDLTQAVLRDGTDSDLYVDAIFGSGLTRPSEGEVAEVLHHMGGGGGDSGHYRPRTVAVDAPSGLDLDSGHVLGRARGDAEWALHAALTVTFDSAKPGHFLALGPALCGRLVVKDIGIGPWRRMDRVRFRDGHWGGTHRVSRLALVGPGDRMAFQPGTVVTDAVAKGRWSGPASHKYAHGHALLLAGPPGRGGAARLAARGALRVGAGLVTLAPPPEAIPENAARLDAVMLRPLPDAAALTDLLADPRLNALCAGPGLGLGDREAALLEALLAAKRPTILDADALTLLARRPDLCAALHDKVVLTPHDGEFARLFPDLSERMAGPRRPAGASYGRFDPASFQRVQAAQAANREAVAADRGPAFSKVDAAREAAARLGCTVLLKGPDTVIAEPPPREHRFPETPPGRAAIHSAAYDRAAPWLATAGSGDVLAGMICGLLARGFSPFDAACTAAWLHVEAARSFGPGLIAEDLPEELPKVFRALGL